MKTDSGCVPSKRPGLSWARSSSPNTPATDNRPAKLHVQRPDRIIARRPEAQRWKDFPASPRLTLTRAAFVLTRCCGLRAGEWSPGAGSEDLHGL